MHAVADQAGRRVGRRAVDLQHAAGVGRHALGLEVREQALGDRLADRLVVEGDVEVGRHVGDRPVVGDHLHPLALRQADHRGRGLRVDRVEHDDLGALGDDRVELLLLQRHVGVGVLVDHLAVGAELRHLGLEAREVVLLVAGRALVGHQERHRPRLRPGGPAEERHRQRAGAGQLHEVQHRLPPLVTTLVPPVTAVFAPGPGRLPRPAPPSPAHVAHPVVRQLRTRQPPPNRSSRRGRRLLREARGSDTFLSQGGAHRPAFSRPHASPASRWNWWVKTATPEDRHHEVHHRHRQRDRHRRAEQPDPREVPPAERGRRLRPRAAAAPPARNTPAPAGIRSPARRRRARAAGAGNRSPAPRGSPPPPARRSRARRGPARQSRIAVAGGSAG